MFTTESLELDHVDSEQLFSRKPREYYFEIKFLEYLD